MQNPGHVLGNVIRGRVILHSTGLDSAHTVNTIHDVLQTRAWLSQKAYEITPRRFPGIIGHSERTKRQEPVRPT